ncbi:MAG TPA: hypothetical protein VEQ11_20190 [Chloroflexota bacterium]|nr:hypothetical protein [Chloroflexota bacterium]
MSTEEARGAYESLSWALQAPVCLAQSDAVFARLLKWVGVASREPARPLFSPKEVQTILDEFADALAAYREYNFGVSEERLPHRRERIQQALKQALVTSRDEEVIDKLEVAYVYLASFLPEPDGSIAMAITRRARDLLSRDPATLQVLDPQSRTALEQSSRLSALIKARRAQEWEGLEALRTIRAGSSVGSPTRYRFWA